MKIFVQQFPVNELIVFSLCHEKKSTCILLLNRVNYTEEQILVSLAVSKIGTAKLLNLILRFYPHALIGRFLEAYLCGMSPIDGATALN